MLKKNLLSSLLGIVMLSLNAFATPSSFSSFNVIINNAKKTISNKNDIRSDKDWIFIIENSRIFTEKLIANGVDMKNTELLKSSDLYLKLGYSKENFDALNKQIKTAAKRLIEKYNLQQYSSCKDCATHFEEKVKKLENATTYFKENAGSLNNFYSSLVTNSTFSEPEENGPGCGLAFYACAAVCAASIEIFPVYIACCGVCMCEYCSTPPAWLGCNNN
ncbi:MAG: hypothetical protein KF825_00180 [Ferruginibacter sp.]|nr:hypothetical protein [Ferruginibacter sp.]MBX2932627.1 hypothetical protein [Ferruginibacter sp.]